MGQDFAKSCFQNSVVVTRYTWDLRFINLVIRGQSHHPEVQVISPAKASSMSYMCVQMTLYLEVGTKLVSSAQIVRLR
jgi:hypothetical protein